MTGALEAPKRIQRQRTKGWRMPLNAVYVGRPSKWGNPNVVVVESSDIVREWNGDEHWCASGDEARGVAVRLFRMDFELERFEVTPADAVAELAGRDLVCWCPLDQPCHADVLLQIANSTQGTADRPPVHIEGNRQ